MPDLSKFPYQRSLPISLVFVHVIIEPHVSLLFQDIVDSFTGKHIPIISPKNGLNDSVDYAFLGAWNFKEEIKFKEKKFLNRGGKFIVHVPSVRII